MLMFDNKIWVMLSELKHKAVKDGLTDYVTKVQDIIEELEKTECEAKNE